MAAYGSYIITTYKAIKLHEEREKKGKEIEKKKEESEKENLMLTTRSTLS